MRHLLPLLLTALVAIPASAHAARIKDIARWQGVESNDVVGVGIVVGLQGTGDRGDAAQDMLRNAISALQVDIDPESLQSRNAAVVLVTATLPPFSRRGDQVDVTVSSMGDARSLLGGTLVSTPLLDPQGRRPWAVAQGALVVGGYVARSGGSSSQKNHTNAGRIPAGAKVVRDLAADLGALSELRITLRSADFHTAVGIAAAINGELGAQGARALDSASVAVAVPQEFQGKVPQLISRVEVLDVPVDRTARVVVNERTGTVVMGSGVRIRQVAIAHGSISVEIKRQHDVSQPAPLSLGTTEAVVEDKVTVEEPEGAGLQVVEGVSIGDVVAALNALGVTPRDLIAILEAIRAAGALDAELEVL